jgi:hypothetical protein
VKTEISLLQSQILRALATAARPLSDVQIWAATGGHELGGHGAFCVVACLELEGAGLIELDQEHWRLTREGREVSCTCV